MKHLKSSIQSFIRWFRAQDIFNRADIHQSRGHEYYERYQATRAIADLDTAIQQYQEVLERTSTYHGHLPGRLRNLAVVHHSRYRATGASADINIAIQHFHGALNCISTASLLECLGDGYYDRYQATKASADLDIALEKFREALEKTPTDHSKRANLLESLGRGYGDRYQFTGAITDLKTAIQRFDECRDEVQMIHPEYFHATESIADRNTTIQQLQEALEKTPADHSDRVSRLENLGFRYRDRYRVTKAIADLDTAMERFQETLDKTLIDSSNRARALQNVGAGYLDRYAATGAIADLDTAMERLQEALDQTPIESPKRAYRLLDLGLGYHRKYYLTKEIADLDTAIQLQQDAVEKTVMDDPERIYRLASVGSAYLGKYGVTKAIADFDTAIQRYQEVLDTIPINHPIEAEIHEFLGLAYVTKFLATRATADLNTGIEQLQKSCNKTPIDHADRARRFYHLSFGYFHRHTDDDRHTATMTKADMNTIVQELQESFDSSPSFAKTHLQPGMALMSIHSQLKNWPEAFQAASKTVSLVPLLTTRSLKASDKHRLLKEISGLGSDAASVALSAAKTPFDAIQLLELAREVIAGSLNELRGNIPELQQKHPQLAKEYNNLRNQLDNPETSPQRQIDQRYNTGQKLEEMIQRIRTLPGFDRFLLAPSEDELKSAAEYGPIVIINVSVYRCDALIIENHQLRSLELPRLVLDDIQSRMTGDLAALEVLEWLWETIAHPVLNTLGFTQPPSDGCWARMWWIPTGPLNKFPLHAAGYHTNGSTETVLDRVISSYSSSVKAIIHGRRQRRNREGMPLVPSQALLVAMEHTPGSSSLPSATDEVKMLHDLFQSMKFESIEPGRRKQDVVSYLPHCDIFHFAGHGYTDEDDPSKSHLLLEDGKSDPLTVANLLELNLRERSPFLAYLSACGTGRIKGEKYVDENIHLISACQLAGYRHVIGTLWEVNDKICVDMARITYNGIRDRGMTDESVAWGLHNAARELRDRWLSMPAKAERGSKLAGEEDASLGVEEVGVRSANDGDQRDTRLPRDIISCDDNDKEVGLWVPYVHFGV